MNVKYFTFPLQSLLYLQEAERSPGVFVGAQENRITFLKSSETYTYLYITSLQECV